MENLTFDEPRFVQFDSFLICLLIGRFPNMDTFFLGVGSVKQEDNDLPLLKYEEAFQRARENLEENILWEISCNPYRTESDFDPILYGGR